MRCLTCKEAAKRLKCETPNQAFRDFSNDSGLGSIKWKEPPESMEFRIVGSVRLHYVEEKGDGSLFLRAETCDDAMAMRLAVRDAGVGRMSIRAQLFHVSKTRPRVVWTSV